MDRMLMSTKVSNVLSYSFGGVRIWMWGNGSTRCGNGNGERDEEGSMTSAAKCVLTGFGQEAALLGATAGGSMRRAVILDLFITSSAVHKGKEVG